VGLCCDYLCNFSKDEIEFNIKILYPSSHYQQFLEIDLFQHCVITLEGSFTAYRHDHHVVYEWLREMSRMKLETCNDTELTCKVKHRELIININVSHSLRYQGKCTEVFCTV
jgi:hypothetical protein